ncbi:GNAT family N-acetyltransferase [Streptomyces sp. NPDC048332]|uniref:GNAT family N-acetyltransferase n=1 Tax=Streptomyces sp. NPDC048332 TaxID=3154619 RepID=UPI00341790E8
MRTSRGALPHAAEPPCRPTPRADSVTGTDFRIVELTDLLTEIDAATGSEAAAAAGTGPARTVWDAASVALLPPRLGRPYLRPGDCRAVVASRAGRPVGILPLLRGTPGQTPQALQDPGPELAARLPADPGDLLFVGGCVDLVAGAAVAAELTDEERRTVRRGLVDRAWDRARRDGLVPLALHVRDAEVADFLGPGRRAAEIGVSCLLRLPSDGSDASYLAGLGQSGRRTVLKDRRSVAGAGLRSEVRPAAELTAEAAELVVAVKRRYGVEEHPRLVRARLARWAADPAGERVAFAVCDAGGPVAVTFGCVLGTGLEIYETGLADGHPHRHEAYAESLFQAPIAFAQARGITEIDLGLDATIPKTRRGAALAPTWVVTSDQ